MSNLNKILIFKCQNEHVLEHDLPVKKNFTTPKIYNTNGDLSKRWYVYFSFFNPQTGKRFVPVNHNLKSLLPDKTYRTTMFNMSMYAKCIS